MFSLAHIPFAHIAAVACGGAFGALLRYVIQLCLVTSLALPVAILVANILGSFAMGFVFVFIEEKQWLAQWLKPLIMVGFLGALTTFSSVSLDTVKLLELGQLTTAFSNILLNVLLTLMAVYLGMSLARILVQ